ncbi:MULTISPECIES: hypothetical protein [unclassified Bartonella]|uniref:hypothetical protein n=1 Tax=unclassified Bartonella TaxID=2645622 RepID=UPI0035D00043
MIAQNKHALRLQGKETKLSLLGAFSKLHIWKYANSIAYLASPQCCLQLLWNLRAFVRNMPLSLPYALNIPPPLMTEKQMILINSNVRSVVMRKAYCIRRYDLSLKMMICQDKSTFSRINQRFIATFLGGENDGN